MPVSNPNPIPASINTTAGALEVVWRQMLPGDIPGLVKIGETVHPSLPESIAVFTERLTLFPEGCLVLTDLSDNPEVEKFPTHTSIFTKTTTGTGISPSGLPAPTPRGQRNIYGYAISHPIPNHQPPALDSLLGSVPINGTIPTQITNIDTDNENETQSNDNHNKTKLSPPQYYIHDVAILPELRGRGLASVCIRQLLEVSRRHDFQTTVLISVYGTSQFWGRYGFQRPEVLDEVLCEKVRGYGDDAMFLVRTGS